MTDLEKEILAALRDLEQKVAAMKTAQPKPSLLPAFELLDALAQRLPPSAEGSLKHYLQRKSYEKARALLESRA